MREISHDVVISGIAAWFTVISCSNFFVQLVEPKKCYDVSILCDYN